MFPEPDPGSSEGPEEKPTAEERAEPAVKSRREEVLAELEGKYVEMLDGERIEELRAEINRIERVQDIRESERLLHLMPIEPPESRSFLRHLRDEELSTIHGYLSDEQLQQRLLEAKNEWIQTAKDPNTIRRKLAIVRKRAAGLNTEAICEIERIPDPFDFLDKKNPKTAMLHALTFQGSPVLKLFDDRIAWLGSTQKASQLLLREIPLDQWRGGREAFFWEEEKRGILLEDLDSVEAGGVITQEGLPLPETAALVAQQFFEAHRNGVKLFPRDGIVRNLQKIGESQRKGYSLAPRHWGQELLDSLNPVEVIAADVFGSPWKLYVFDAVFICEADSSGNATYIGRRIPGVKIEDTEAYRLFTSHSRGELLELAPDALVGRVVHRGDSDEAKEVWKKEILDAIGEK